MKRLAIAALLLSSAGPARAQEPDPNKVRRELERLSAESAAKDARLAELQKQLSDARDQNRKQKSDIDVHVRQLEVQLAQIQELTLQAEHERSRAAQLAAALDATRRKAEPFQRELPAPKASATPRNPSPPPVAVAPTVTPSAPAPAPLPKASADELHALRSELEAVRRQVRALSDRLLPAFQDPGVAVEPLSEEFRAHLGLGEGVIVRQVREGSPAERAGLQAGDIVPGRTEAHLLEAVRGGVTLEVLRRGRSVLLPPNRGR